MTSSCMFVFSTFRKKMIEASARKTIKVESQNKETYAIRLKHTNFRQHQKVFYNLKKYLLFQLKHAARTPILLIFVLLRKLAEENKITLVFAFTSNVIMKVWFLLSKSLISQQESQRLQATMWRTNQLLLFCGTISFKLDN